MGAFPELTTERCLLRQIRPSDQGSVFQGLSHPEVIPYYGVSFATYEETAEQMRWYADLESNRAGIWWAICDRHGGEFFGACGFNAWDHTHRKAEIGFWLLPAHWNKGLMQEVMPVICEYGFDRMDLHRIEGFVESENRACKKALANLPFQHEGTMKDCEWKNGKWISVDIYALVNVDKNVPR